MRNPSYRLSLSSRSITIALSFLLGWALYLTLGAPTPASATQDAALPDSLPTLVRTRSVLPGPQSLDRTFYGVTAHAASAIASFTLAGRLTGRPVSLGDSVGQGDLLASLDSAPYRIQLRSAQASVDDLRAQLDHTRQEIDRAERLVAGGIGDQRSVDHLLAALSRLESGLDAARAGRDDASRALHECELRAPFAATVIQVFSEPGETVAPGTPILALAGPGRTRVELEVPEWVVAATQQGAPARVSLPLSGAGDLPARVVEIGASAHGRGRLFPLHLEIDSDAPLASGLSAVATLPLPAPSSLRLPLEAVTDPTGSEPTVFRVRNGVAQRVPIAVVGVQESLLLAQGELVPGDVVVVSGQSLLTDGQAVEVAR